MPVEDAWAALARAAAWACPLRMGRETSFAASALAELLPDGIWMTKAEAMGVAPSLGERALERALAHLVRLGAVEERGDRVRLSGDRVGERLERLAAQLRARGGDADDPTDAQEHYTCAACGASYSALDAVASLTTDVRGFFCTCGGDLGARPPAAGVAEDSGDRVRAQVALRELAPLLALCTEAKDAGPPPAPLESPPPPPARRRGSKRQRPAVAKKAARAKVPRGRN